MQAGGIMSYLKHELIRERLVDALLATPPPGHRRITLNQVVEADKELWFLMSTLTNGVLDRAEGVRISCERAAKV